MYLKFQAPVPGQQPNITAGGLATMLLPSGFRYGVIYAMLTVTKAAGGAGVYSLPVLTDVASPVNTINVKIGGNPQRQRLASELIAGNLLQDVRAAGSVSYYQGAAVPGTSAPTATVQNALNTAVPATLAANTATTAVFVVPIYLAEYWRRNLAIAESLAWPTVFSDGSRLGPLTVEVPIAANAGGAFSGWSCSFFIDYDSFVWPASQNGVNYTANGVGMPRITKQDRYTQQYAAVGDVVIQNIKLRDQLQQFSILVAAGDRVSKVVVKKNGIVIRNTTKEQNDQTLLDHDMNAQTGLLPNRYDVVFDVNDDPNSALPLLPTDILEVTATLSTVAAANTLVLLTESFGVPY